MSDKSMRINCEKCDSSLQDQLNTPIKKSSSISDTSSICSFSTYCPNPDLKFSEIKETLCCHLNEKYKDIIQAFRNYDKRASGLVFKSQLKQILRTYCIPLTDTQFCQLMKELNYSEDAQIKYKEFLSHFVEFDKLQETIMPHEHIPTIIPIEEIEVILKHKISQNLIKVIQGMWLHDVNKDGKIQTRELRKIIENYCCCLTDIQFKMLMRHYDPQHNNTINYKDFLIRLGVNVAHYQYLMPKDIVEKTLRWPEKLSEEEMTKIKMEQLQKRAAQEGHNDPILHGLTLDEIKEVFKHKLRSRGYLLERAFKSFDPNDTGFVSLENFHGIINYIVMPVSDGLFTQLLKSLDIILASPRRIFWRNFLKDYCQPYAELDKIDPNDMKSHECLVNHLEELIPNSETKLKSIFGCSDKDNDKKNAKSYNNLHEDKLKKKLKSFVIKQYQEIEKAIKAQDWEQSGRIKLEHFREILEYFCFPLSDDQYNEILNDLDVFENEIEYLKFFDLYKKDLDEETQKWIKTINRLVSFKSLSGSEFTLKEAEEYLREAVRSKRNTFLRDFYALDYSDVGLAHKADVKLLFDKHAFRMSDDQFEKLWNKFPTNEFNKLKYRDFVEEFGKKIDSSPHTPPQMFPIENQIIERPKTAISQCSIMTIDLCKEMKKPRVRPHTPFPVIKEIMNPLRVPPSPSVFKWPEQTKVITTHGIKPRSPISVKSGQLQLTVQDKKNEQDAIPEEVCLTSRGQSKLGKEMEQSIDEKILVDPSSIPTPTDYFLQKRILWRCKDIVRRCKLVDSNHSGIISADKFQNILNWAGIPTKESKISQELANTYDIKPGNQINYWEFLRKFLFHIGSKRTVFTPTEIAIKRELEQQINREQKNLNLSEKLHNKTQQTLEELINSKFREIKKRCETEDPSKTGLIPGEKLKDILKQVAIPVNDKKIEKELASLGLLTDSTIDYLNILSKYILHLGKSSTSADIRKRRKLPPARIKVSLGEENPYLTKTLLEMRGKVTKNFRTLSRQFLLYDKNMTGLVECNIFRELLQKIGVVLPEEQLFRILEYYDPNLTGKIAYAEFLRAFVTSA
ncbi:EF-hand calcium-binding domain-containing protein 6-like isoform X2 [Centruroides sculpturatus]|uniref:EF-hand calcium-binding domain-containing protein 6-like isoform X2 n=1 Tax=Centruroides sculpturatus TaxID=218467 RepID=UPI000C6D4673|nr:EF-hand calcium-binding domain-containing protein 6-like isoform X2 [Centruroides sculpturatus]